MRKKLKLVRKIGYNEEAVSAGASYSVIIGITCLIYSFITFTTLNNKWGINTYEFGNMMLIYTIAIPVCVMVVGTIISVLWNTYIYYEEE